MSSKPVTGDAFGRAPAEIPTCALEEVGIREQRARYARLAPSVTRVQREPEAVSIEFDTDFDRQTLEQALAIERDCCPFFRFAVDERRRKVRVRVAEPEQLPALDVLAEAFEPAHHVASESR